MLVLLIFLPVTSLRAEADSLYQAIRSAQSDAGLMHAKVLLARHYLPERMDSARVLLEDVESTQPPFSGIQQAEYFNTWGLYYWFKRNRAESIRWYSLTLQLPPDPELLSFKAAAANNIGSHYFRLGEPDSSRVYLMMSLDIDEARGNETGMAKTYYDLTSLHHSIDQHELALRYINEAIRIQERDGDKERLMHSYTMLGNIFTALVDAEKASEAYELALQLAGGLGVQRTVIMLYSNLSGVWCTRNDGLEKTIHYFESGIDSARESGHKDLVAVLLGNMGTAWLTAGEAEKALGMLEEALDLVRKAGHLSLEMQLLFRFGQAQRQLGQMQQSRLALENSLGLARRLRSPHNQSRALLELAALDSLQGNYRGFSEKYIRGIALRDSVWNKENRSRIAELQILHETEQKELRIAELEARQKVTSIRQRSIIAVSLLVISLLVSVLLYIQNRRTVIHQGYIIKQQEKEKIEAELDANRRELTGKALSLARSDQIINKLKKDIKSMLSRFDHDGRHELQTVLRMLKSRDNSEQLWKEFEHRFNELNQGFITRLSSHYPTLSPSEVRLCAMLRLQMSTKDIAELIQRSTRTIENTRNSVRKKMGLSSGDNLVQHLLTI